MKHDRTTPPTLEYASPRTDPNVPTRQIVIEFLGGLVLLVLAAMFFFGTSVNLIQNPNSITAWVLATIYLLAGVAFGVGGAVEIGRGIRHQRGR